MRSTPAPVVDVSAVHGTEDDLTRIQGGGGLLITFTLHFYRLAALPHLTLTFRPRMHRSLQRMAKPRSSGWLVSIHF